MQQGLTHRQQVFHVYKSMLRTTRHIPSYNHREHVFQACREKFRANAGLAAGSSDASAALSLAETQLDNLQAQAQHLNALFNVNTLTHNAPKPSKLWEKKNTLGEAQRHFSTFSRPLRNAAADSTANPASSTAAASSASDSFASYLQSRMSVDTPAADGAAAAPTSDSGVSAPSWLAAGSSTASRGSLGLGSMATATHIVHIRLSPNNTIVTLTDLKGDTKCWASGGSVGFKTAKKSTYIAAIAAGEQVGLKARNQGIQNVDLHIAGLHKNKKAVVKGLIKAGLNICVMRDTTPIPFNGCKPKKKRRL